MGQDVAGEILEPGHGGLRQVANEGQWIFEDALQGRARLLDVPPRTRADDVEDNLEQLPHRVDAPADELAEEADKYFAQFDERFRNQNDVFERERFERRDKRPGY